MPIIPDKSHAGKLIAFHRQVARTIQQDTVKGKYSRSNNGVAAGGSIKTLPTQTAPQNPKR